MNENGITKEQKQNLERRGFRVYGDLVERSSFWGTFRVDTRTGQDLSSMSWIKVLLISALFAGGYWVWAKGNWRNQVYNVV